MTELTTFEIMSIGLLCSIVLLLLRLIILNIASLSKLHEQIQELSDYIAENQIDNINELLLFRSTVTKEYEGIKDEVEEVKDLVHETNHINKVEKKINNL